VNVDYNRSLFYVENGYLYRINGNNHKSRIRLSQAMDEYVKYKKENESENSFKQFAIGVWKQSIKTQSPEHFTIRRNKKEVDSNATKKD